MRLTLSAVRYQAVLMGLFVLYMLTDSGRSYAQTVLTVTGSGVKPLSLQTADLAALPHTELTATDKDQQTHRYSGVALAELLRQAGVPLGGALRGKHLLTYVIATATDGYAVVFALPKLDPELSKQPVLLADRVDGAPLPAGIGPYRLIVPADKKPTRWVRALNAIQVQVATP